MAEDFQQRKILQSNEKVLLPKVLHQQVDISQNANFCGQQFPSHGEGEVLAARPENDTVCRGCRVASDLNHKVANHHIDNKMKKFTSGLLLAASCLTAPAYAIDFWHSNTVWAGQGQCSAVFTFDSGLGNIEKLQVSVSAVNKSGKKVASGALQVPQFGQSSETRYAEAFLEGEDLCEEGLVILVNKATAIVDGKRMDLLKSKILVARNFNPYKIKTDK